jgi:hypothetical protein
MYIYYIFSLAFTFKIYFRIIINLIKLEIGILGMFVKRFALKSLILRSKVLPRL